MPIAVICPGCQRRFSAPDAMAGRRAKCSACGEALVVPSPAAQPAPQMVTVKAVAQPASKAVAQPAPNATVQPAAQAVVVKPVGQSGPQVKVGQAVGQPVGQAPARVVVGKPVGQAGSRVAVGKPVGEPASPSRAATAAPRSQPNSQPAARQTQPAGGNSLLDLLEQADSNGLPSADVFGASGGAFPPARAKMGRPAAGKNFWTSPPAIGLGIAAVMILVGGVIVASVLNGPADDEPAANPQLASNLPQRAPQQVQPASATPPAVSVPVAVAPAQPAPYAPPPAAVEQGTQYSRDARDFVVVLRQMADLMASVVDAPSAVAAQPKMLDIQNRGKVLFDRLESVERNRQLTWDDAQLTKQLEPELNQLAARINAEGVRLQNLAAQLKMQDHFAHFNQAGFGPMGGQQPQFVPQQPQFVQPARPPIGPQHPIVPRPHGPRHGMRH